MLSIRLLNLATAVSLVFALGPSTPVRGAASQVVAQSVTAQQSTFPTRPNAASTGIPTSKIDEVRQQFGGRHTIPSGFIETFDRLPIQIGTLPDVIVSESGDQFPSRIVDLPVGDNDSISFRSRVNINDNFLPNAITEWWVKSGPTEIENYANIDYEMITDKTPQENVYIDQEATIANRTSETSRQRLLFMCGNINAASQCEFSQISIYSDIENWFANGNPRHIRAFTRNDQQFGGTHNSPYLWVKIKNDSPNGNGGLAGPQIKLPTFTNEDITIGLDWAVKLIDGAETDTFKSDSFSIDFYEDGTSNTYRVVSVYAGANPPTVWQESRQSASIGSSIVTLNKLPSRLSGKTGRLVLFFGRGYKSREWGIDNIQVLVNGQPIRASSDNSSDDQFAGACDGNLTGTGQCSVHDPVNTASGTFWRTATDMTVSTGGLPLQMDRTYVSLFADASRYATTTLGAGWRHSYDHALTLPTMTGGEPNTVIYEAPSGSRVRFRDTGTGFTPAPGVRATLARDGTEYVLTMRDQRVLRFDATGRIISMRDAADKQHIFAYTPAGLLASVTDNGSSRTLTFAYSSGTTAPRLETVTDSAGRVVRYTYTPAGQLETVRDLRGGVTTYGYVNGTALLERITDPLGRVLVVNTYDQSVTPARVTQQQESDGTSITYQYQVTATGQTTTVTRQRGATSELVKHHYRADRTLEWVEQDNKIQRYVTFDASLAPTTLVDGQQRPILTDNTSVGLPTRLTDASGLVTQSTYTADHDLKTMTDPSGVATTITYTGDGHPRTITQQGSDGLRRTTVYTYTADQRVSEMRSADGVVTAYAYTAAGQVERMTVGVGATDASGASLAQTTVYAYDGAGRMTDMTVAHGTPLARTTRTEYNDDSTVKAVIQNYKPGVAASDDVNVRTEYGYDLLGRPTWERDATNRYTSVRHYDAHGRVDWEVRNPRTAANAPYLPTTVPVYAPTQPDANVVTTYTYDNLGRLSVRTESGIDSGTFNTATLQWSAATTRATRTEYDALSRPVTTTLNYRPDIVTNPPVDVNVQTYTYYDGAGNVIWQSDMSGRWTKYEYDTGRRPVRDIVNYENGDPATVASANSSWALLTDTDQIRATEYNERGLVSQTIEHFMDGVYNPQFPAADRKTTYGYDSLGRQVTVTQNAAPSLTTSDVNRTTTTRYDAVTGRVRATQDPLGRWTVTTYDAIGRPVKTITNCRSATGVAQDANCAVPSATDPTDRNISSERRYNLLNQVTQVIDPLKVVSTTAYDGLGRPTTTVQNVVANPAVGDTAANQTTSTQYDVVGRVIATTDAGGYVTTRGYDGLDRVVSTRDPVGRLVRFGYDGSGQSRWTQQAEGQVTVTHIDGLGRTLRMVENQTASSGVDQNLTTTTSYTRNGRTRTLTNPANQQTTLQYDQQDRLVKVIENAATTCAKPPCNVTTSYQYDRAGNQVSVTDARGHTRTFTYTAADEQRTAVDALGQTTTWEYDAGGRMAAKRDPRGSSYDVTYAYDGVDRLTGMTSTSLSPITMRYNVRGERVRLEDETGVTTFAYDALGRTQQVASPQGTLGYGYDVRGLRTGLTYPDGTTVRSTYTPAGQLERVSEGGIPLVQYSYDVNGRLQLERRGDGSLTTYAYDGADRLRDQQTTLDGTTLSRFQYDVDQLGLRTQVVETLDPTTRTVASGAFLESGGQLVVEAEQADQLIARGQHQWTVRSDTAGFTGLGFLRAEVDRGVEVTSAIPTSSPEAQYQVQVADTGTYYVWLRVYTTGSGDDTVHLGLNGHVSSTADKITTSTRNSWVWTRATLDGVNASINIGTAGIQTVNLWMQEDGMRVDRILLTKSSSFTPSGTGPTTTARGSAFTAQSDQVVAEGEHAQRVLSRDSHSWVRRTDRAGAVNGAAVLVTPDTGVQYDTNYAGRAAELQFQMQFKTAGTYYVWVRGSADDGGDNSVHVGVNGVAASTAVNLQTPSSGYGTWAWSRTTAAGSAATITVPTAGVHTINVWMREDGFWLDRLLLTKSGTYTPSGIGPSESPVVRQDSGLAAEAPPVAPLAFVPGAATPAATTASDVTLAGAAPDAATQRPALVETRALGGQVYFTDRGVAVLLTEAAATPATPERGRGKARGRRAAGMVYQEFVGGKTTPTLQEGQKLPGVMHDLRNPAAPRRNIPTYAGVQYPGLYKGIDLVYDGQDGALKGTYTVAPGADPSKIRWRYRGAAQVTLDADDNLVVTLPRGTATLTPTLVEHAPNAWQQRGATRVHVDVRYVVDANQTVRFALGTYDRTLPLVIDPAISSTGYVGGDGADVGTEVVRDGANNVLVGGWTNSWTFPGFTGAVPQTYDANAFVAKLTPDGRTILWTLILGGSGDDRATGLGVDAQNDVYLAGTTSSPSLPTTTTAYQSAPSGSGTQSFVAKLAGSTGNLAYFSYYGGSATTTVAALAVLSADRVALVGTTAGVLTTTAGAAQTTAGGGTDAFLTRFRLHQAGAAALESASYVGGSGNETGVAVVADSAGAVYLAGTTNGWNGTSGAAQLTPGGGTDSFVQKMNAAGSVVYRTLVAGSGEDLARDLAVGGAGRVTVVGQTTSPNLPTPAATLDPHCGVSAAHTCDDDGSGPSADAFIFTINDLGTSFDFGSYWGGSGYDDALAISLDATGQRAIAGVGTVGAGSGFPLVNPLDSDGFGFVTVLDTAHRVRWSSALGASDDTLTDMAWGGDGYVTVTMIPESESGTRIETISDPQTVAQVATTRTLSYGYDGLNRLTQETDSVGPDRSYQYDLSGNRTRVTQDGSVVWQGTFNAANQVDGWTYDEAGNLLDDGTRTYTYDALNRLTEAETFYRYNGDGVLVANGSEAYLNDLTLGLPQVLMREIGGSRERYLYGQARLAQVHMLGVRTWAHADALGTPRLTRTTDGVIVDAPRTDAWGRPLHGTEPQPFGFTGELQDRDSDLVYLRARWYNPTSGTFLSRDPFVGYGEQPYSLHPYQYAYSQPTTLTDRSGERVDDQAVAEPRNADSVLTSVLSYMHNMRDLRASFDEPERRLLTWLDLHPYIARTFVPNAEDPYQQQLVTSFYHTFQWGDPDPYGVLTLIELEWGRWCLTYGGCADDDGLFVRGAGGVGQNDESCVAGGFGSGVGSAAAWMTLTRKFAPDTGGGGGVSRGVSSFIVPDRIALGMQNSNLRGFAKKHKAQTFEDMGLDPANMVQFAKDIRYAMEETKDIRFNLQDMQYIGELLRNPAFGPPRGSTNWELQVISANPHLQAKSTFYLGRKTYTYQQLFEAFPWSP